MKTRSHKKQTNGKAKKLYFLSPTKGMLTPEQMVDEIAQFVGDEPHGFYRLVIGTDSEVKKLNGKAEIDYVTAIVVHRKGKGARYFWRKEREFNALVLRDRIYSETLRSLDIAHKLVPSLRNAVSSAKYDLEIHIDVGPLGKTRDMIKMVVGMVNGSGYMAKIKPQAWGAASVADRHT